MLRDELDSSTQQIFHAPPQRFQSNMQSHVDIQMRDTNLNPERMSFVKE